MSRSPSLQQRGIVHLDWEHLTITLCNSLANLCASKPATPYFRAVVNTVLPNHPSEQKGDKAISHHPASALLKAHLGLVLSSLGWEGLGGRE